MLIHLIKMLNHSLRLIQLVELGDKSLLGVGAAKKVYRAFDQLEGKEVAWNQISLKRFTNDEAMIRKLYSDVELLSNLKNEHIIAFHHSWTNTQTGALNFITEACASGSLRDYTKKRRHLSIIAVKKWCRQILKGLEYLHLHDLALFTRTSIAVTFFLTGTLGRSRLEIWGWQLWLGRVHRVHSMIGKPEFMAPEFYEENYPQKVDIYSSGMCLLEMMRLEIPYRECDSIAKIHKVSSGTRPKTMDRVKDPQVKGFIEKCLGPARPSARFLKDPFFDGLDDEYDYGNVTSELSIFHSKKIHI